MTYHAKVIAGGKIVIPADLRREFGIKDGDTVALESDGERIALRRDDSSAALAQLRQAMKGYTVDQFLRERRADWGE
ncbi:AbrB/MazE/SpoVT family DNA-binding domain-containing protein [Sphingomonas sp. BK235]|jgi:AbrB family transcriptional regulator, stage V sporulation protein T|uniref:AbrB/MazE/SpoVT family DNA-binding domain-containing protein n=1 Tax=Sphingomonas sp. BK235 TaxID=2512131 RepID=UPI00104CDCFC|nr:AbrB/MazE/SpoVT family DNA-binding domain-containing protein [Sphingomonas sp. BK235]TCP34042.1 AbrB family looped-hinge helix DNA binding protein [Sphingomonas sp. BK235]